MAEKNNNDDFQDPLQDYEPKEYDDPLEEALAEGSVTDIAMQPVAQISADATTAQALKVLGELQVSSLLVIEDETLVGVFTERDALERVVENYDELKNKPVRDVMTKNPIFVSTTDAPAAALSAIAVAGYRHVPVLDVNDKVVGIISPRRVFAYLKEHMEAGKQ